MATWRGLETRETQRLVGNLPHKDKARVDDPTYGKAVRGGCEW